MKHTVRFSIMTVLMGLGMLLTTVGGNALAQQGGRDGERRREEIKTLKIAFFTDALKLTPQESEKFWPVYNQYWNELRELGKQRRILLEKIRKQTVGEREVQEWSDLMTAERDVTQKYGTQFKQVLPINKVAKVFVADEDFKNYLIRQAAEIRGGGR